MAAFKVIGWAIILTLVTLSIFVLSPWLSAVIPLTLLWRRVYDRQSTPWTEDDEQHYYAAA